jgi:hypothetical protein
MRTSWEAVAVGEGGLTAALAGLSAVYFLRRHARGRERTGRHTATLALGMSAAGAAMLAAHGVSVTLSGERAAGVAVLAGLPALVGQALMALMLLRRRERSGR